MPFDREKWRTKPKSDKGFHLDKKCWWYHSNSESYCIMTYKAAEDTHEDLEFICDAFDHETDKNPARAIEVKEAEKREWEMRKQILQNKKSSQ